MRRFKFSKTNLTALAHPVPGEPVRYVVYDTEVQKLLLAVTAGSKTFYVVKRTGGKMTWIKLGSFPEMTVERARKEAETVLGEFTGGVNRAAVKRALRKEPTFEDAFKDFLISKRKRSGKPLADKTKRDYEDLLRLHLGILRNDKLSEITRAGIKALHMKISRKSPAQADKAVAVIGAVFTFAIDRELFSGVNPAARVQKNEAISRDRFVTADELPHIIGAIMESSQRDFFLLALLTGARRGNVQSMAWRDLDLDGGVWRIPTTKNGEPQNVPLGLEAVTVLLARKETVDALRRGAAVKDAERSGFVFAGKGKTGHLVEPKGAWATILRRASLSRLIAVLAADGAIDPDERLEADTLAATDLPAAETKYHSVAEKVKIDPAHFAIVDLRPHDLRRTLGSWQAINNTSLAIIGASLGHKTHQATEIYARLSIDPVRQSVSTATAAILDAAGAKKGADVISIDRAKRAVA